ncbi:hypothetical protein E8E11_002434 [Didymella keratinophila]|nr:hypothetical protein E8E11_002434 [Didymella keratinophila]
MKVSILCSATLFTAAFVFPANLFEGDISKATLAEITSFTEKIARQLETRRQGGHVKRTFSAEAQRISTTGDHKYMTMASTEVFGMGLDLSAFLAVYSAVMAGDLTSFSIGVAILRLSIWTSPVTFFALNPATYQFTYRFFANHTAENPEGYLDEQTLMTFEGVTKKNGEYKWSPERERIPENWYKRFIGDEYTIAAFTAEAVSIELANPELIRPGGNTGEPNTFTGVNVDDLTGKICKAETLLEETTSCASHLQLSRKSPLTS